MAHAKGCKPDPPHAKGLYRLSHELLGASPANPDAVSHEEAEGDILDQNGTSACTGHGTSQALEVASAVLGVALPFRPSPRGIYALARLREETTLSDDGATISDVVQVLAVGGVRALVEPSPEGYASDVDASNVNTPPTSAELSEEHSHLEAGPYRVDTSQPAWTEQLCAGIHKCGSAIIGGFVDSGFEAFTKGAAPVSTIDRSDPAGGGHCLAVTSYRTGSDGKRIFRGPNSWGPGWGDAGHWEATEDWMRAAVSDCYVFALAPSSRPPTTLERILAAIRSVVA